MLMVKELREGYASSFRTSLNIFSSFSAILFQSYFSATFFAWDFIFSYSAVFLCSSMILLANFLLSGLSIIPPPFIIRFLAAFSG